MSQSVATSTLDGITVTSTATGEQFTASCDQSGNVTLDSDERNVAICTTVGELAEAIRDGEFYIPDPDEWQSALEAMGSRP